MHTIKTESGYVIHYNSDLSGNVIITAGDGPRIELAGEIFKAFYRLGMEWERGACIQIVGEEEAVSSNNSPSIIARRIRARGKE